MLRKKKIKGHGETNNAARRGFLKKGVAMVSCAAAAQLLPSQLAGQQSPNSPGTLERLSKPNGRPILLKDGIVLSLDPKVGDFEKADVLIQGKKIVSVGPSLSAPAQSIVVNASRMIVMPGFIDTHHHQYETILRGINADGRLGILPYYPEPKSYRTIIQAIFTPAYQPDDARIAELLASLSQINDGVTTTVDTSQVQLTPEHTDACIAGLKASGRRCLFAYSTAGPNGAARFPAEIQRLRSQYFSSDDQLLTLGSGGGRVEQWKVARSLGAPIIIHVMGTQMGNLDSFAQAGLMGPDNEYIHCTRLTDAMWKKIADTGGKVSIASAIEMKSGQGIPPIQAALDHGIQPSLSVDNESSMPADFFTQMRATFTIQRALINERVLNGEQNVPALLKCRDAIEMATIAGARVAHLDSKVGTLTPGKEADVIMLTTNTINVAPLNNVPGAIVTLMDTTNIGNVFIAGKVVKWQGKLVGVDVSRVVLEAQNALDGLLTRTKYPRDLFGSCCIA